MTSPRVLFNGATIIAVVLAWCGCARTPAQRYARYVERGQSLAKKKDYTRALLEFRNASKVLPQKAEPIYQAGLVYVAEGDFNQAALTFQKAAHLEPSHVAARLKLAGLMVTSQKPEILQEVERMAGAVLAVEPQSSEALRVRALAELRLGKTEQAVRSLQQATSNAPQNVRAAATLAATNLARRDIPGAEAVMKKLTESSPKSPEAWMALSHFYRLLGRRDEADKATRTAAGLEPRNDDARLELALLYLRDKNLKEAEDIFKELATSGNPDFNSRYAMFLFGTGRRQEAIREFEAGRSKYPDDRQIRNRLVMAYVVTGRTTDAQKLLEAILKRNPKDVDALEMRARISLAAGKFQEAERDVNEVLRFRTDSPDAHYLRAHVYLAGNNRHSYQQELGEVLRLKPAAFETRLELSRSLRADRQPASALQFMNDMPKSQQGVLGAIVERNWALFDLRKDTEMRRLLTRALKVVRDRELLLQDALLCMREKRYQNAQADLNEILGRDPENYRAIDTMLALYLAENKGTEAAAWLREHAARRPASAPMQVVLGQWLEATGDPKGAREAYLQAKTLDSKFRQADLQLATLDLSEGNLNAARERLNLLLAADPRYIPARLTLGAVEEKAGDAATAVEHYQLILVADPDQIVALNNLAFLVSEYTNDSDGALAYAQKAYQFAPNSPAVNDTIGWIYYKKHDYQQSLPYLEAAVKLQATAKRTVHLALAYYEAGRREMAAKTLNQALKMQPDLQEAQSARMKIASIR